MKFICTKDNLSYALDLVCGVASKHINLPILSNVLVQVSESKVTLMATNLEVAVKANLRAKVEVTGEFTIPAKTLLDYVHLLPDEQVEIELQGNEVLVKCGNSSTKIKGSPAEDYPVMPDIEEKISYVLNTDGFKESLSQVVFAAAKNEIRPELSGIYFGFFTERFSGLLIAATDSYRLAEKKVLVEQGKETFETIVPARSVYEVIRLITIGKAKQSESTVRVWVSENQLAIRYDDFEMTTRLVDGKYPDYSQIIPAELKTNSVLPISVLINKIKAASLFTTTGVNAVSFDLSPEQKMISISSTSTQTGEHASEIEAEVTGDESSILLNHRYVLDGLQNINTDEVEFKVNSSDSPCVFKPKDNDEYLYIVMPIRQ
ncbi:MAG: DNA polymerase III subunit beta [Candidatus Magasanikbacteria bacterium]|nr:DNA polymerase III subunit beta [Candidatus Magasanikbacteria bacterium]MBT6819694.1 DNA polymerase III subunit beta [Candidatus Magasanikbacteria bacterium]